MTPSGLVAIASVAEKTTDLVCSMPSMKCTRSKRQMDRTNLIILDNLISRLEYNERSRLFSLKGNITQAEFDAIGEARKVLRTEVARKEFKSVE